VPEWVFSPNPRPMDYRRATQWSRMAYAAGRFEPAIPYGLTVLCHVQICGPRGLRPAVAPSPQGHSRSPSSRIDGRAASGGRLRSNERYRASRLRLVGLIILDMQSRRNCPLCCDRHRPLCSGRDFHLIRRWGMRERPVIDIR
jgi:hypothetical protein